MYLLKTAFIAAVVATTISASGLAAPVMPAQMPTGRVSSAAAETAAVSHTANTTCTGVIVDARGLGLEATFSPLVYDTDGRVVYGATDIDPVIAMSQGMVAYATSLEDALATGRAGANPLFVRAVAVRNGRNSANQVNVVVSVADGDRITQADRDSRMLKRCAVVFVK